MGFDVFCLVLCGLAAMLAAVDRICSTIDKGRR